MTDIIGKIRRRVERINNMLHQRRMNPFALLWLIVRLQNTRNFNFVEIHDNELDLLGKEYEQSFLNWSEQKKYLNLLNPRRYYILARNKYLTHLFLDSHGVKAKAKLFCYYNPEQRTPQNDNRCSWDLTSTINNLKQSGVDGCVVKSTESSHGDNVWVFKSIDFVDNDALLHRFDGKTMQLSDILGKDPLVFESIICQSKQFQEFNSDSVNTIRFMTNLMPNGEVRIIATFIKIGRSGRCVDNAGGGGNVDAAIDIETGKLYNTIEFRGWRNHSRIDKHPDNGTPIEGVVIENWESIKQQVLDFQRLIPFVKAAGWDVAITDEGPVVIEVNDMWDRTGQLFLQRGWRREIKECYDAWRRYYANN